MGAKMIHWLKREKKSQTPYGVIAKALPLRGTYFLGRLQLLSGDCGWVCQAAVGDTHPCPEAHVSPHKSIAGAQRKMRPWMNGVQQELYHSSAKMNDAPSVNRCREGLLGGKRHPTQL